MTGKYQENVVRLPDHVANPRSNLGSYDGVNNPEASFLRAFERSFFARANAAGLASGEFAVPGFGIADLVWIGWEIKTRTADFTTFSLEKKLRRRLLFAFEGKIKDWRRALHQAFRYRYFADKAIVVMPSSNASSVLKNLHYFRQSKVGFWSFNTTSGFIYEHFTPTRVRAFNPEAKLKAIRMIASKVDFSEIRKKSDTILN